MRRPAPEPPAAPATDPGSGHLRRIERWQWALWPAGAMAWAFRSRSAALVFAVGGAASILFWHLHRVLVGRMLTPSLRRRWFYGALTAVKLALIVLLLRGMIAFFPAEVLPLVTGLLLFSASILLEAAWLVLRPETHENA